MRFCCAGLPRVSLKMRLRPAVRVAVRVAIQLMTWQRTTWRTRMRRRRNGWRRRGGGASEAFLRHMHHPPPPQPQQQQQPPPPAYTPLPPPPPARALPAVVTPPVTPPPSVPPLPCVCRFSGIVAAEERIEGALGHGLSLVGHGVGHGFDRVASAGAALMQPLVGAGSVGRSPTSVRRPSGAAAVDASGDAEGARGGGGGGAPVESQYPPANAC